MNYEIDLFCKLCEARTAHEYHGEQKFLDHYAFDLYNCKQCGGTRSSNQTTAWLMFGESLRDLRTLSDVMFDEIIERNESGALELMAIVMDRIDGKIPEKWTEHLQDIVTAYGDAYRDYQNDRGAE